jgi:hypothetical protein
MRAISRFSMHWFRSNRDFGVRLALIALTLQFVLAFGHVHLALQARPAADQALSSTAARPSGSDKSDRKPNGSAELDCPVCALLHPNAAATPSVAPLLPLPATARFVTLRPHADASRTAALRISQQARAPPAA